MFPAGTLYSRRFADMNTHCSCCSQNFEPEPGYYYGAMFVSYAFSTAIFLAVIFGLSLFVKEVTTTMVFMTILVIVVGLLPVTFRLSRALWINIFIHYEGPCPSFAKNKIGVNRLNNG
ncbi:DUF983 domain-containing protein [Adhaeribacter arboris]|uniref:DUF983 domain-containing protein n=2 Tax=Adhaeribacter arboris TaxID=2072846 RepID=A0A2T2YP33_9BACT|nr:DUF983 domain-containing protein [Adhaeribacter arboris]